ncbi:MAG: amidohydrolase family protein [Saprospiraceae bacterium]|nr:amidohydrolase family protein [Saprospiraceae bacterium]
MDRRTFTQTCLTASGGLLPMPDLLQELGPPPKLHKIPKTDTHVHLFDLNNLSYGWLNNASEINRSFSIRDFQKASKQSHIGKILFMESGADAGLGIKEARWVASLVKEEPRIKGIIANLDLSGDDAEKSLAELKEVTLLKGIRGKFPEAASESQGFLSGLKSLAHSNLSFDFLISLAQYDEATNTARKCPDNVFVLDHLGNPNVKKGDFESWRQGINKLAEQPNINCKLSGIITKAGKDWTEQEISPYLLHCIDQFGMDRLVYGGDWPVVLLAGSYLSWSRAFEKITGKFSENELHKIYHLNADRIYNL